MRGLNLSRLASRGRAAEGIHSARLQAEQTMNLRQKLSSNELSALRSSASPDPTVDVLGSISGQSALGRLAVESARAARINPTPVVRANDLPGKLATIGRSTAISTTVATRSEPVMRALGANKFGLYQRMATQRQPSRPLPGSEKYAEGAAVGMASISMATLIVGSIGATGIGMLYFKPGLVDEMRFATRRFRAWIESGLGNRLKAFSERMRQDNAILSKESKERAQRFARNAVKARTVEGGKREDDAKS